MEDIVLCGEQNETAAGKTVHHCGRGEVCQLVRRSQKSPQRRTTGSQYDLEGLTKTLYLAGLPRIVRFCGARLALSYGDIVKQYYLTSAASANWRYDDLNQEVLDYTDIDLETTVLFRDGYDNGVSPFVPTNEKGTNGSFKVTEENTGMLFLSNQLFGGVISDVASISWSSSFSPTENYGGMTDTAYNGILMGNSASGGYGLLNSESELGYREANISASLPDEDGFVTHKLEMSAVHDWELEYVLQNGEGLEDWNLALDMWEGT
jgi:hypothetical protein